MRSTVKSRFLACLLDTSSPFYMAESHVRCKDKPTLHQTRQWSINCSP